LYKVNAEFDSSDPDLFGVIKTFSLQLTDPGQTVITSRAFPTVFPDLGDLAPYDAGDIFSTDLEVGFFDPNPGFFRAELASLTVPEPGTALLLSLGLCIAIGSRRRS
jgi:hypothetical protein